MLQNNSLTHAKNHVLVDPRFQDLSAFLAYVRLIFCMFVLVQVRELQDRLRWYQGQEQQGGQQRHVPQSPRGQVDRNARNEDLMQMATAIGVS